MWTGNCQLPGSHKAKRLRKAVCHQRTPPAILDLVGRIQTQNLLANTALFVTWPCVASGGSFSLCSVCQMPKSNLIWKTNQSKEMLKGIGNGEKTPEQQWAHFNWMFKQRRMHSIRVASEGIPKWVGAQRLESKIPHDFPMSRSVADRIMASKNVHSRSPEPVKTLPYMVKRTMQLRIRIRTHPWDGELCWIIQVSPN